jgi:uncharacterized protein with NAD-binding domain and iron-sulfur cluster
MSFELKYDRKPLKIAIVGASVGGCSCAYFLTELFRNKVEIDIFEQSNNLGKYFAYNDKEYNFESNYHSNNLYLRQFCNICCKLFKAKKTRIF